MVGEGPQRPLDVRESPKPPRRGDVENSPSSNSERTQTQLKANEVITWLRPSEDARGERFLEKYSFSLKVRVQHSRMHEGGPRRDELHLFARGSLYRGTPITSIDLGAPVPIHPDTFGSRPHK